MSHPPLDAFGRRYLTTALQLEGHIPGFVDAYIGPPALRAAVAAAPAPDPAALRGEVAALQAELPTAPTGPAAARRAYLAASLRAMDTSLRIVQGEPIDYETEVALLYDITPQAVPDEVFLNAHRALDDALPGTGGLAERSAGFRRQYETNGATALPLLELARAETRRRTAQFVDLPPGEEVTVELVRDQAWGAYNWYLGDRRSLIQFNTDLPLDITSLTDLFAHEGYPGHHTEHLLKEELLYRRLGYAEQAVALLHSPSAVIAEGIATTAQEIIFSGTDDAYRWMVDTLFPAAGVTGDPAQLAAVAAARQPLRYVSANAALYFHIGRFTRREATEYIAHFALSSPERTAKTFAFIANPLYRSYVFTYVAGYDLLDRAARSEPGGKTALFRRLLTDQMLPSTLARLAS